MRRVKSYTRSIPNLDTYLATLAELPLSSIILFGSAGNDSYSDLVSDVDLILIGNPEALRARTQ